MAKKVAARTLDFTNVKESSGISKKHKPDGEYLARVTEVRDDPAKDGEAMWMFIIQLSDDRTATYPYYCKLVDNQLWKLRNLFLAAGKPLPKKAVKIDPNQVVGKEIGVILEGTEYEGREQSEIAGTIPKSELSDYAPAEPDDDDEEEEDEEVEEAPKRRRKAAVVEEEDDDEEEEEPAPKKRGRGRPKKVVEEEEDDDEEEDDEPAPVKRGRGRPRKVAAEAPAKKKKRRVVEDDDDLDIDL